MAQFSERFVPLLKEVAQKEHERDLVQAFRQAGGEHRIVIAVDHPDAQTREIIQGLIAKYVDTKVVMQLILQGAETEFASSRDRFVGSASNVKQIEAR